MRWIPILILVVVAGLAGCADSRTPPPGAAQAAASDSQSSMLDPLVMPQKPADALSVRDVLKHKKDGETVVVSGRTPPANVKPFNSGVAAFVLMAPEDLAQDDIKEELECEDAATCPSCKKLLDQFAVRVELVDGSGVVVPASAEGFRGLKPGDPITVEGEVKRDGKDGKTVRIVARRFYPG